MSKPLIVLVFFIFCLTFEANAQCPDVTAVMGVVQSPTSISVSWTPPTPGIFDPEGYHVFYRKVGDPTFSSTTQHKSPWINEIKYRGVNEGFEIIGPDELDLNCYKVQLFRANGSRTAGNNGIRNLSGKFNQINATNNYFEAIWDPENFDSGGGYIALYYEGNSCDCPREDFLVEFLAYGNPASPDTMAATVHPILDNAVIQSTSSTLSSTNSIGLTDFDPGDTPNDFSWQEMTPSPNALNVGQVVYPKLAGSNNLITIEDLVPCTEYEFFIRSDCSGTNIGNIVASSTTYTTQNSIKDAAFFENGTVLITELKICEGVNPNFIAAIDFQPVLTDNTCSIQTTYFITTPAGIIVNSFPSVAAVNNAIQTLPNNPYLIQAIGHHNNLSGTGFGDDINNVTSTSCLRLSSFPIDLKVFNIPTITTTPTVNPSQCGSSTGSITVNITGDNPALGTMSYKLNSNPWSTNSIFTNLPAGINTILVQYTDAVGNLNPNNCFASTTIILTDPSGPVVATSPSPVSCNGGNDGGIVLNPPGGANYSYAWSNGAMTQNIGNLVSGNYAVTITDGNTNCTSVITGISVTEPPAITITISNQVDPSCNGGNDGSATASAVGGSPGYSYTWSSGATSSTANDLVPGTNSVTVVDINGCSSIQTFTLGNPPPINISAIEDSPVVCNGEANGSATITANGGTTPYTYLWDSGETTLTANLLNAGNHSYTVTDNNGCTNIGSVTINEPDVLGSNMPAVTNISCNGVNDGEATIAATGGNSPYTYAWSNGETTVKANSLAPGTTSYTVTDDNGCTFVSSVIVTQPDLLSATAVVNQNVSCNGLMDGVGMITATGGTGPYTYIWGSSPQPPTVSNLPAGSTIFAVIDANGCVSTGTIFVNQPNVLSVNAVINSDATCNGSADGVGTISANGGTMPYQYMWGSTISGPTATNLPPGANIFSVVDANGCISTGTIFVDQSASWSVSISTTNPTCFGVNDGVAIASQVGGGLPPFTYLWNTVPIQTNSAATGLSAGNYSLSVTDYNNCTVIETVQINDPPAVVVDLGPDVTSCAPPNTIIDGMNAGLFSYEWSNGYNSSAINVSSYGIYSLTITDTNGCKGTDEIEFVSSGYNPHVRNDTSIIFGTNVQLYAGGGDTYMWTPKDDLSCEFCTNPIASPKMTTDYTVVISAVDGCVDTLHIKVTVELEEGNTVLVPDLITPNGDSKNDKFTVYITNGEYQDAIVKIFNRTGAQVYEGEVNDSGNFWDGTYYNDGKLLPDGSYWYMIVDNNAIIKKGGVTMIGSTK